MVASNLITASNANISSLDSPVALFVGSTSGIGEYSLKAFAKHAPRPRIYFVGRSPSSGARVAHECRQLNPDGQYHFIQVNIGLIKNVDSVCEEIRSKEKSLNLLFMSAGGLPRGETEEGLMALPALQYYAKMRFIVNLLPLLRSAIGLRRVVIPWAGGTEGPLQLSDLQLRNSSLKVSELPFSRGHVASLITLGLVALSRQAPEVSFIHNFPGNVRGNLLRDENGMIMTVVKGLLGVFGKLFYTADDVCGDRHAFFATSARFPPKAGEGAEGVPTAEGVAVAKSIDGVVGGGVYVLQQNGEISGSESQRVIGDFIKDGVMERVWKDTAKELRRITGKDAI